MQNIMPTITPEEIRAREVELWGEDKVAQNERAARARRNSVLRPVPAATGQRVVVDNRVLDVSSTLFLGATKGYVLTLTDGSEVPYYGTQIRVVCTWFVVVERSTYEGEPMDPYVVGPYDTEAEAEEEGQSDAGIIYCLLTIDAKSEGYVADECYWTEEPPAGSRIIPS